MTSNGISGVTSAVGIYMQTATSGTNEVHSNFIHSLNLTTTGAGATMSGIHLLSGNMNVYNNMIRLGINASGSSITQGHYIFGIREVNNVNNIYHNSIYIGGSGVVSAYNTYCFFSGVNTSTRELKNNIFLNARSNASGSAKNYAINLLGITGLSSNNNLLNASGTGAVLGAVATNDYNTLSSWQLATSLDNNSITGDPRFMNATGNAGVVDLHIDSLQNTPIEAMGTPVAAVTLDFDLENRAGLTPVDIGADAGDFTGIDETPPSITYTSLTNACNTDPGHTLSNVYITDNSGVNVTPGTKPRLYFKKSGDANDLTGWKFVEASGSTSPFSFTFNFSDLNDGGVSMNDVIQYFVVAQDEGIYVYTPNVAINNGVFTATPSSVALTATAFPVTGTIKSFTILPCSGTVTVGTGGDYPAFTTANGLFQALNQATVNGNMTVSVISDITIEDGTHALNEFTAPHTITIQPDGNTLRNVTGTYNGASAALAGLFRLNSADRVIFDGRDPGNLPGGGRYLLFRNSRNTSSSNLNSTFTLINDATNDIIRYCVIEGATVGTTNGVILFSTALATGNSNNQVDNCVIKNAGVNNTTLLPTNGIVSAYRNKRNGKCRKYHFE